MTCQKVPDKFSEDKATIADRSGDPFGILARCFDMPVPRCNSQLMGDLVASPIPPDRPSLRDACAVSSRCSQTTREIPIGWDVSGGPSLALFTILPNGPAVKNVAHVYNSTFFLLFVNVGQ